AHRLGGALGRIGEAGAARILPQALDHRRGVRHDRVGEGPGELQGLHVLAGSGHRIPRKVHAALDGAPRGGVPAPPGAGSCRFSFAISLLMPALASATKNMSTEVVTWPCSKKV